MNINQLKPGTYKVIQPGAGLPTPVQVSHANNAPQESFAKRALMGTAGFLGVKPLGQGLATAGRVASGAINQTGNEAAQALMDTTKLTQQLHQMVLNHVPANDPKRVQLVNFIKNSMGQQPTTQAEIDPGTTLSNKQVIGSAIQTGANLLPGAASGTRLATKVGIGAGTGYAFDVGSNLQQNKPVGESLTPGVGTAVGAAMPIAGAGIRASSRIVGRLFKGLGSGLSGVSSETIDKIVSNPKAAQQASERLAKTGNAGVLEENARSILNGISQIKSEARAQFGQGLEGLAKEDINPTLFRQQLKTTLDKYGVVSKGGAPSLKNVEFTDPKSLQKAKNLIKQVNVANFDLNGKNLRRLVDNIESSVYKTATSDERLSYNAFANDLAKSVKAAITGSTDKLNQINHSFSQDMQLAQAAESIFGKVNFKNLPEVLKASQKLENLFGQKGLAPEVVNNFLERIGVNANDFNTGEAVRQIANKHDAVNAIGLNTGEILRAVTSAVVPPKAVGWIAIKTGLAKNAVSPFLRALRAMSPYAQKAIIEALLSTGENQQPDQSLPGQETQQ